MKYQDRTVINDYLLQLKISKEFSIETLIEELNDDKVKSEKYLQSFIYKELVTLYMRAANTQEVIKYYNMALENCIDPSFRSECKVNLANYYFEKGEFSQANVIYQELLDLPQEQAYSWRIPFNIALCYKGLGDYKQAHQFFLQAIQNLEKSSPTSRITALKTYFAQFASNYPNVEEGINEISDFKEDAYRHLEASKRYIASSQAKLAYQEFAKAFTLTTPERTWSKEFFVQQLVPVSTSLISLRGQRYEHSAAVGASASAAASALVHLPAFARVSDHVPFAEDGASASAAAPAASSGASASSSARPFKKRQHTIFDKVIDPKRRCQISRNDHYKRKVEYIERNTLDEALVDLTNVVEQLEIRILNAHGVHYNTYIRESRANLAESDIVTMSANRERFSKTTLAARKDYPDYALKKKKNGTRSPYGGEARRYFSDDIYNNMSSIMGAIARHSDEQHTQQLQGLLIRLGTAADEIIRLNVARGNYHGANMAINGLLRTLSSSYVQLISSNILTNLIEQAPFAQLKHYCTVKFDPAEKREKVLFDQQQARAGVSAAASPAEASSSAGAAASSTDVGAGASASAGAAASATDTSAAASLAEAGASASAPAKSVKQRDARYKKRKSNYIGNGAAASSADASAADGVASSSTGASASAGAAASSTDVGAGASAAAGAAASSTDVGAGASAAAGAAASSTGVSAAASPAEASASASVHAASSTDVAAGASAAAGAAVSSTDVGAAAGASAGVHVALSIGAGAAASSTDVGAGASAAASSSARPFKKRHYTIPDKVKEPERRRQISKENHYKRKAEYLELTTLDEALANLTYAVDQLEIRILNAHGVHYDTYIRESRANLAESDIVTMSANRERFSGTTLAARKDYPDYALKLGQKRIYPYGAEAPRYFSRDIYNNMSSIIGLIAMRLDEQHTDQVKELLIRLGTAADEIIRLSVARGNYHGANMAINGLLRTLSSSYVQLISSNILTNLIEQAPFAQLKHYCTVKFDPAEKREKVLFDQQQARAGVGAAASPAEASSSAGAAASSTDVGDASGASAGVHAASSTGASAAASSTDVGAGASAVAGAAASSKEVGAGASAAAGAAASSKDVGAGASAAAGAAASSKDFGAGASAAASSSARPFKKRQYTIPDKVINRKSRRQISTENHYKRKAEYSERNTLDEALANLTYAVEQLEIRILNAHGVHYDTYIRESRANLAESDIVTMSANRERFSGTTLAARKDYPDYALNCGKKRYSPYGAEARRYFSHDDIYNNMSSIMGAIARHSDEQHTQQLQGLLIRLGTAADEIIRLSVARGNYHGANMAINGLLRTLSSSYVQLISSNILTNLIEQAPFAQLKHYCTVKFDPAEKREKVLFDQQQARAGVGAAASPAEASSSAGAAASSTDVGAGASASAGAAASATDTSAAASLAEAGASASAPAKSVKQRDARYKKRKSNYIGNGAAASSADASAADGVASSSTGASASAGAAASSTDIGAGASAAAGAAASSTDVGAAASASAGVYAASSADANASAGVASSSTRASASAGAEVLLLFSQQQAIAAASAASSSTRDSIKRASSWVSVVDSGRNVKESRSQNYTSPGKDYRDSIIKRRHGQGEKERE